MPADTCAPTNINNVRQSLAGFTSRLTAKYPGTITNLLLGPLTWTHQSTATAASVPIFTHPFWFSYTFQKKLQFPVLLESPGRWGTCCVILRSSGQSAINSQNKSPAQFLMISYYGYYITASVLLVTYGNMALLDVTTHKQIT